MAQALVKIMDGENESNLETEELIESTATRPAFLYIKTNAGKAIGSPVAIVLPETMEVRRCAWKACIRKAIADAGVVQGISTDEVIIDRLYFINKNSRSLSLIEVNNDVGIQLLLDEYPLKQKNGRASLSRMKLACDWHQKGQYSVAFYFDFFYKSVNMAKILENSPYP